MTRFAVAVYRVLLRLLPRSFRREYGNEAAAVFERVVEEARERGGHPAALKAILRGWFGIFRGLGEEAIELASRATSQLGEALKSQGLRLDVRQALRALRLRPGVAFIVAATVALAVGATTSVYTVVDGVLLRPLDYPQPDHLVRLWQTRDDWKTAPRESMRLIADRMQPHAPTYVDWAGSDTGYASMGAYVDASFTVLGAGDALVVRGQEAHSGLFTTLGVDPILGRGLQPMDDTPDAPRVVVLSEGYWRDRFGGDSNALGVDIILDGTPHTVIGVMPLGFRAPVETRFAALLPQGGPVLWTPLTEEARIGNKNVSVIARLAAGTEFSVAEARLTAVHEGLARTYEEPRSLTGVRVESLLGSMVGDVRATLLFLLGAVALVLVVATVNIANVLFALGLNRTRELAIRSALGAGTGRLVRTLFIESAVLAGLGGLAGVALAWSGLPLLLRLLPPSLPRQDQIGMSASVLLVGVAVTCLTALLVGTLPALFAARADPHEAMRASGRGHTSSRRSGRVRSALVVAEVSLAFSLLIGAGLLANSYIRLSGVERGFETSGLAAMWVEADGASIRSYGGYAMFLSTLGDRLNEIPGINATAANNLPLSGLAAGTNFTIEGPAGEPREVSALLSVGLENYFDVMGIPAVAGRQFERTDVADAPSVAMVNETLASQEWPNESAVGQRMTSGENGRSLEIVGVVADVRHQGLSAPVEPTIYVPAAQSNRDLNEWVLRIRGDAPPALQQARDAVAAVSPTIAVTRMLVLDEAIARSVALPRFRTLFIVGLAGLAAVLALLGVYGMLAFAVARRTKEIGVRMALGAQRETVVWGVVGSGLRLVAAGIVVGLGLTWFASGFVSRFLFEITATDVPTYAGIVLALMGVGLLAAYVPARRAAAVDPVQVLSAD